LRFHEAASFREAALSAPPSCGSYQGTDPDLSGESHPGEFPLGAEVGIIGGNVMLWTIIGILVVLWLLGFSFHVGAGLIHLLLVVAVIVFVVNLISGRRTV
jgi:hypothetical protein